MSLRHNSSAAVTVVCEETLRIDGPVTCHQRSPRLPNLHRPLACTAYPRGSYGLFSGGLGSHAIHPPLNWSITILHGLTVISNEAHSSINYLCEINAC